jgi:hypothetical protein
MKEEDRVRFQGYIQEITNEEMTNTVDVFIDMDNLRKSLSEDDLRIALITYCIKKAVVTWEVAEMADIAEFVNQQLKEHNFI